MGEELKPVSWVIMYCVKDDSHSLVRESAVICDAESLTIGDNANFYYQGSVFEGVVKDIGDNHDEMNDKLGKFNSKKPKKDSSFHADRPRRCAVKCKDGLKALAGVGNSKGKQRKSEASAVIKKQHCAKVVKSEATEGNKRKSMVLDSSDSESENAPLSEMKTASLISEVCIKKATHKEDKEPLDGKDNDDSAAEEDKSGSTSAGESGNSSGGEAWTAEEIRVLKKISAMKKGHDFQALIGLAAQKNNLLKKKNKPEQVTNKLEREVSEQEVQNDKNVEQEAEIQRNDKPSSSKSFTRTRKPYDSDSSSDDETSGKAAVKLQQQKMQVKPKLNNEMYRYTADSNNVEELMPDSDVYVSIEDMKKIRKKATSVTACARAVLRAVFTREACDDCSVGGFPSRGKGGELASSRPALDAHGVDTVVEFSRKRAAKKNWNELSESAIKSSLASMLCEKRRSSKRKTMP